MSNRLLLMVSLLVGALLFTPNTPAQAHVLITDNSGTVGAILHVNPDDDPIAGEPSSLFFDIQSQSFLEHAHVIKLAIADEQGSTDEVPITIRGSSISASYVFPAQGAYTIVLTAAAEGTADAHVHTFTHTQRVSRGASGSALDRPSHAWAELLLVASVCGFLVLVIFAFNHKHEIARYSKW